MAAGTSARRKGLEKNDDKALAINQAQLVLADKRTHLAALRTGIAVLALPMGVVSFLIALSSHFSVTETSHYFVPLMAVCLALALLGLYLIIHAVLRYHHSRKIQDMLEKKYHLLSDLLD